MDFENRRAFDDAVAQHRTGRLDLAEPVYLRLAEIFPDDADVKHMIAVTCLQKGDAAGAVEQAEAAIDIDNTVVNFHNTLGAALLAAGRFEEACGAFRQATTLDPADTDARFNLGNALHRAGRPTDAVDAYRAAIERDGSNIDAFNNLGSLLSELGRRSEAVKHLTRAHALAPDHSGVLRNLVNCLERLNRVEEAEVKAQALDALAPDDPVAQILIARTDRRAGRLEAAASRLDRAAAQSQDPESAMRACFDLGQVRDRMDDAEAAFAAFEEGNKRQAAAYPPFTADESPFLLRTRHCREWYSENPIEPGRIDGETPPVFMVGFPRSGTTLLERMLGAHPALVTTGEDSPITAIESRLSRTGDYPHGLGEMDETEKDRLRREIRDHYARFTTGDRAGRRVVDKMPLNITALGLIWALFPEAPVIVSLRDPRDACLSCFMQQFRLNDAMAHFLKLDTTVRLYTEVMGLWLQYRRNTDRPWIEVGYEDLIDDYRARVAGILEFIDLPWDTAIERYRAATRDADISTPSYEAVSQDLNDRARGRWRRYETHLTPFADDLAPFVSTFGYD